MRHKIEHAPKDKPDTYLFDLVIVAGLGLFMAVCVAVEWWA